MTEEFFTILEHDDTTAARRGVLSLRGRKVTTPVFCPEPPYQPDKAVTSKDLEFWGGEIFRISSYDSLQSFRPSVLASSEGLHEIFGLRGLMLSYPLPSDMQDVEYHDQAAIFKISSGEGGRLTPEEAIDAQQFCKPDAMEVLSPRPDNRRSAEYRATLGIARSWAVRSCARAAKNGGMKAPRLFFHLPLYAGLNAAMTFASEFSAFAAGWVADASELAVVGLPDTAGGKPVMAQKADTPELMLKALRAGADLVASDLPRAASESGQAWILPRSGRGFDSVRFDRNARKNDEQTIDPACGCYTCRAFSRSDVYKLAGRDRQQMRRLLTIHNMKFIFDLFEKARRTLQYGSFSQLLSQCSLRH